MTMNKEVVGTIGTIWFWVSAALYAIGAILFFTEMRGAVGFFGSLLTTPFSTIVYIVIEFINNPLGVLLWLGLPLFMMWWSDR